MEKGKVLALDIGERRIGVAVSDPLWVAARPLVVIQRASKVQDVDAIAKLVQEQAARLIVCGYPISLNGTEGPQGRRIRRYVEVLADQLDTPIILWDESYSTRQAEAIMGKRVTPRKRKQWVDAIAAAVILQSYLDAHSMPADQSKETVDT